MPVLNDMITRLSSARLDQLWLYVDVPEDLDADKTFKLTHHPGPVGGTADRDRPSGARLSAPVNSQPIPNGAALISGSSADPFT
jgi:hypothetical protein